MSVASAIHASAAVLLIVAGVAKLTRPADGFAGLVGIRARPSGVRILGGAEVVAGVGALWLGGPVAASAVGLLYAAFAVAVLRALATGAGSCGCFGRLDAPPSRIHVGGNLVLAGASFVAAGAATAPVQSIAQSIGDRPVVGAALVTEVLLVAGLTLVAFTALPEALGARASQSGSATLFQSVPPPAAGFSRRRGAAGGRDQPGPSSRRGPGSAAAVELRAAGISGVVPSPAVNPGQPVPVPGGRR